MVRAATVGVHPQFVAMIRELVVERIDPTQSRAALGSLGLRPDVCPRDCCPAPAVRPPTGGSTAPGYAPAVLHHLTMWVPDLERAEESWSWLLGELDYVRDRSIETVLLFRHHSGFAIVLEQSSDMVPGMLYSRMRPGLNHLAFARLRGRSNGAADHCTRIWLVVAARRPPPDCRWRHGGYLEDRDGFEVELVVPSSD